MPKNVFLGGTMNNTYRGYITTLLIGGGVPAERIIDPTVKEWSAAAQEQEDRLKADPSVIMLFYLRAHSDGSFLSFYSLAEAIAGLYDNPQRTAVIFDYEGMQPRAARRLAKVRADLKKRHPDAMLFESVDEAATWLIPQLVK